MKKKSILDLKNENSVISYIEMLESNISRMSGYSGIIKASICTIYTILVTILISAEKINNYWWLAIVITFMGAIVDAYYLALERTYVDKYNKFIANLNNGVLNENSIYDMRPRTTELKCELLARTINSMFSFSIFGFYLILISLSLVIKFM